MKQIFETHFPALEYVRGPFAGGPIGENLRVRLSGGSLALCGASDTDCLGTAFGMRIDGQHVLLRHYPGAQILTASTAINAGASVFAAASGKVAPTGTVQVGVALESAAGDGSKFNVAPV
jgi:hypothetical protein